MALLVQRVLHLPACTALRLLVGRFAYVQPCGAAAGGCVEIAVAAGPHRGYDTPRVIWDDGRPERPPAAAVSNPPDPKALAKQFAGKSEENEYTPDEHVTNIRLAGAKREHRLI